MKKIRVFVKEDRFSEIMEWFKQFEKGPEVREFTDSYGAIRRFYMLSLTDHAPMRNFGEKWRDQVLHWEVLDRSPIDGWRKITLNIDYRTHGGDYYAEILAWCFQQFGPTYGSTANPEDARWYFNVKDDLVIMFKEEADFMVAKLLWN